MGKKKKKVYKGTAIVYPELMGVACSVPEELSGSGVVRG